MGLLKMSAARGGYPLLNQIAAMGKTKFGGDLSLPYQTGFEGTMAMTQEELLELFKQQIASMTAQLGKSVPSGFKGG